MVSVMYLLTYNPTCSPKDLFGHSPYLIKPGRQPKKSEIIIPPLIPIILIREVSTPERENLST
jgi:hypothetical protein